MGSIFDPEKTVEENKEDAMRDAGHSPFQLDKKFSSKQLRKLLISYLQGTQEISKRKVNSLLKKAIDQEKLTKKDIKDILKQYEGKLKKQNVHSTNSIKDSQERIKHIKNLL